MNNYADRGGCYPPKKPKAKADNTLRDRHNSSYHTKAEFNNSGFIIYSRYFQRKTKSRKTAKFTILSSATNCNVDNMQ